MFALQLYREVEYQHNCLALKTLITEKERAAALAFCRVYVASPYFVLAVYFLYGKS